MGKNDGDNDDAAMRARLDKLSADLAARRVTPPDAEGRGGTRGDGGESGRAMASGLRGASELVAGILIGGFVGWQLDSYFGTKPWLSILFFMLGVAGGMWNVIRAAGPRGAGTNNDKTSGPGS